MNIYVGNLSSKVSEDDLREFFKPFGQVESVSLIKNKFGGESRGFGFVEMPAKHEAQEAIDRLNGKDLKGQNIIINEARPRSDKRRSGGRQSGGRRF